MDFRNVQFITTAVKENQYPKLSVPEVAIAGRSNVGKSSLLNHLFQSKKMVKTSSTPGKTQMLNFFLVDEQLAFADLPGYGYAKVPLSIRAKWGPMVQTYLEKRQSLQLIIFLFDIRRVPNDDDFLFMEWANHFGIQIILVLTKVDKVKKNEKQVNTEKILRAFDDPDIPIVHYSTTKNIGRKELINKIVGKLND